MSGWAGGAGRPTPSRSGRPDDVAVTPTQRACAYFFLVVGLLFVIQTLVGAASEHYRADLSSFFGFDLARWLPYNLVRTWHVQLSIFWTATSFLAAGLFLAPDRLRPRAAPPVLAGLRAAGRARRRRVRQHDRRAAGHPRMAVAGAARVRDAGLGVPGPGPGLAGAAHPRPVLLGLHAVPRSAWRAAQPVPDQPAVAVLLHRAGHPGVLRGGPADQRGVQLHRRGLLAVHGRPPVGRGLPRDLHHRPGGLPVRDARRHPPARSP